MKEKDTVVIIPALNEEDSIGLVLDEIPKERILQVIVVDNGSTDQTKMIAETRGAVVIAEPIRGYGRACLTGIEKAKSYKPKVIAFLDGDYSDYPSELSHLLQEIDRGNDLVIGSRVRGKHQKGSLLPQAIFGNWLATNLMYLFFGGTKFTDLGPFRAIKKSSLESLQMKDEDFGWTVEMQIKALKQGLKVNEIPVSYKKRIGQSKISGTIIGSVKAGIKILFVLFKSGLIKGQA